jgi:hypothetical protein
VDEVRQSACMAGASERFTVCTKHGPSRCSSVN